MKYANSLKYMNSFDFAANNAEISQRRVRLLCENLGRVNLGTNYIVIPEGSAGHAVSVLLESIIKKAGYTVGRISSQDGFDSRCSVFVNGEVPAIEEYNKCVAELKSAVLKTPEETYFRQEVTFVLSLLLCKLYGCEYVILQGLSNNTYSLDSVCAPYDLIIIPSVYEDDGADEHVKYLCEAIRRGTREVVSGNQRTSVYNLVSNACVLVGVRLNFTSKSNFNVTEISGRHLEFSYSGRSGYCIKSPSLLLRDCAMLAIESALAIRRDGIKIPWSSISSGLECAGNASCFDIISVSPAIIADSASTCEEISMLLDTYSEIGSLSDGCSMCIGADNKTDLVGQLSAFEKNELNTLIIVSISPDFDMSDIKVKAKRIILCDCAKSAATQMHEISVDSRLIFCVGSVRFSREIKAEYIKLMGL